MALQTAMEIRRPVAREPVGVEIDEERVQFVDLTVAPLADRKGAPPSYLVLFVDRAAPRRRGEAAEQDRPLADGDAGVRQLEAELRDARERLQSTIEEYEVAIEEVKSANGALMFLCEEMKSTNKKIETSNE